jgi:hypothetical protein
MRMSAGKWGELVSAWEASGQTSREFALARGITESSLRWWKGELSRRARKLAPRRSPGPRGREPSRPVALARVVREGEAPPRSSEALELMLGDVRVAVAPGFDAELLREVVRALSVRG